MTTCRAFYFMALSLSWMFPYCYFGSKMTTTFAGIGESVSAAEWYNYPDDVQKCLTLIIMRSQKPMVFNGWNMFGCNLETYAAVMKSL